MADYSKFAGKCVDLAKTKPIYFLAILLFLLLAAYFYWNSRSKTKSFTQTKITAAGNGNVVSTGNNNRVFTAPNAVDSKGSNNQVTGTNSGTMNQINR